MNDRFLFRAWDEENKKMLPAISLLEMQEMFEWGEVSITDSDVNEHPHWAPWKEALNPKELTYLQCSGLKDKNGKLIYEGDVLAYKESVTTKECNSKSHIIFTHLRVTSVVKDGVNYPSIPDLEIREYDPNDKCTCEEEDQIKYIEVKHGIGFEGDSRPCSGFVIDHYGMNFNFEEDHKLKDLEIVGNIYEHSHLLTKTHEQNT